MTDELSGPDPFLREVKLEVESTYYPLGFPLHLATNSTEVHTAAQELWGKFPPAFKQQPLRVRVAVRKGGSHPPVPVYRGQEHLMSIVADAENFAVCDHTRNFAFCRLNAEAARDPAYIGYYFLQAIANYTLTQLYLTPLHGACVASNGRGMLLCGPSGAGKTTLAYYCARNGWTYISDNESWLLRAGGGMRILGDPNRIRFRATAQEVFRELIGRDVELDVNGKLSIALMPQGLKTGYECQVERVVFLARETDGPATTRALPHGWVLERLLSELPLYESSIRYAQRQSLERLSALKPVELRYSRLDDAIGALEELLC